MINDIINGIANALHNEFGDEFEIVTDGVEQGFKEPCFFIQALSVNQERFVGNRYHKENFFAIHYFSKENTTKDRMECLERLFECLEYIYIGEESEMIAGTNMKYEEPDEVIVFFVNYNGFVYKNKERVEMENINYKNDVEEN